MSIKTWNGTAINDGTAYSAFFVTPYLGNSSVQAETVARHGRYPLVGGVSYPETTHIIEIFVLSVAGQVAGRAALRTLFETESGQIKTLIVDGDDDTEQYIEAVCEAFYQVPNAPRRFQAVLKVHNDPAWKGTVLQTDTETIVASDQEWTITNSGDQIARPTITITPIATQSSINPYRRFVAVTWRGDGIADYPTDIVDNAWDTAALVSGSKMQADGDDIRVAVNGVLVDYWLDDINTDNTSVWVNLDWQKAVPLTLTAAVVASGTVEIIDVNEAIDSLPSTGILLIENELFLYTSKNNSLRRFTILARAAHGTAEAAHTATTAVAWIQHTIEVFYGNSALAAWEPNADFEPILALATSTNAVWDYDNFGGASNNIERPGSWVHGPNERNVFDGGWQFTWYSESQFPGGHADGVPESVKPWQVMGMYEYYISASLLFSQAWSRPCPCGLTAANFQNGYKYAGTPGKLLGNIYTSYRTEATLEYTILPPSSALTWEAWSRNETTLAANVDRISFELRKYPATAVGVPNIYLEAGDVTLTFDTDLIPTTYMAPEVGNYSIDATLTHVESGWALQISYAGGLDVSLVIDTDSGDITNTADGSSQFQAVRRLPRPRIEWLPLLPGINTLKWTEVGVAEVDVIFQWRERRGA